MKSGLVTRALIVDIFRDKCFVFNRAEFGLLLWKISLLARVTNKGRKNAEKKDKIGHEVVSMRRKNLSRATYEEFMALSDYEKEERCMRVWRMLRKYFTFVETEHGWNAVHPSFAVPNFIDSVSILSRDITPKPNKLNRRKNNNKKISVNFIILVDE